MTKRGGGGGGQDAEEGEDGEAEEDREEEEREVDEWKTKLADFLDDFERDREKSEGSLDRWKEEVKNLRGIRRREKKKSDEGEGADESLLHDYQVEGVVWMIQRYQSKRRLGGSIIADEMGKKTNNTGTALLHITGVARCIYTGTHASLAHAHVSVRS